MGLSDFSAPSMKDVFRKVECREILWSRLLHFENCKRRPHRLPSHFPMARCCRKERCAQWYCQSGADVVLPGDYRSWHLERRSIEGETLYFWFL